MRARKIAKLPAQAFQLTLHIRHPSMDPREISQELEFEADEFLPAGGPQDSESGVSAGTSVTRESYWAAALDGRIFGKFAGMMEKTVASVGTERMPEIFLPLVCGRLFAKNKRFLQRIRAEGGSVSMVATIVGDPQCAFKLTPELARQVSEIGITIDFQFIGR